MKRITTFIFSLFTLLVNAQDNMRLGNEFLVMLKPQHNVEELLNAFPQLKAEQCLSPRMNIWHFTCSQSLSNDNLLLRLRNDGHVRLAQHNHLVENRSVVPDDTHFNQQWGMLNTGQSNGVVGADIEATEAWASSSDNVTAMGDTLVIAVIDGKFDLLHEDINFFVNYDEIPANNIDDDNNGYIDDVQGWNAYDNNGDVTGGLFSANHGTHVSGIAGAKGNNALGVAGVCWGAKILPISGSGSDEATVVIAYNYAREMRIAYDSTSGAAGAFVVSTNSSFGINSGDPADYPLWCAMYDSLGKTGILSAGATANSNSDIDVVKDIPTACLSDWLISVTNTTRNDARNGGAAFGLVHVDLGAPGTGIYSTTPNNNYGNQTGTSMATPHVAGSIAAMYSAACPALLQAYKEKPDSVALLIKQYLLEGAEWISGLNFKSVTSGRLNLYRAFQNLRKFNCDSCDFEIDLDKVNISCAGIGDGALSLGQVQDPYKYSYLWSTGLNTIEILNCTPGFYVLQVMDTATGCRRYATAEMHDPDSIFITTVNTIPALNGNPGNITIVASAGNEPLTYSLDGVTFQPSAVFSIPSNGTYTVYVKNTTGCVVQQSIVVSALEELEEEIQMQILPNPADKFLSARFFQTSNRKVMLELFTLDGRKLWAEEVQAPGTIINTENFLSGTYMLKAGNAVKKIVVLH